MEVPGQLTVPFVNNGVTMILATTGEVPVLMAVNGGMSPVPEAPSPIPGKLFVQENVVVPFELVVLKVILFVCAVLQTLWLSGWFTWADGLTMMVKVLAGPSQVTLPLVKCGVTEIVAVTGEVPVLTAEKEVISPLPNAARPMDGVSLVHVYVDVPPVFIVLKVTRVVVAPLQTT